MCSDTNSRANSIAPSLKYCPNEKLPSISKNVRWCPSRPTSSMSTVRKHFCDSVVRSAGGGSWPRKNGICGCIPAVTRSVESSPARGTSEVDGQRRWPRSSKNERKPSRSSAVVRIPGFYERCRRQPDAATPPEAGLPTPAGPRCEAPRRARSRAVQPRPSRHGPPRPRRVAPGTRTRRATGRQRSR